MLLPQPDGPEQSHERAAFDPQIERAESVNGVASVAEGLGRTQDVDGDGHARLSSPAG